jgi:glycerol-3-phosphate acyltransferase PlsY
MYASIAIATLVGYLLGSIPFGLILTRIAGLGDIRQIGSGNIGATNVLRTGNRWLAGLTLLLDALKGAVAVWVSIRIASGLGLMGGAGAFIGHLFPVWLGFRGGKGVATYLGVLAAVSWPVAIVFALVWLGVAALSRFSSLAALAASLVTPIVLFFYGERHATILFVVMTVILWLRHHENIRRLLAGTEGRIGEKK